MTLSTSPLLLLLLLQTPSRQTSLVVTTVTQIGEPIDAQLEILSLDRPGSMPLRSSSGEGLLLSRGKYLIKAKKLGCIDREQLIEIDGAKMSIRIGMNLVPVSEFTKRVNLSGRMMFGRYKPDGVWMKLIPLVNNQQMMETPIDHDGSFVFDGLYQGEYLLIAIVKDQLIKAEQITCYRDRNVEWRLP